MFQKLSIDQLKRKTIEDALHNQKIPVLLVLDNIRSMHNVGSIFRTADAFQIEKIFLCGYTPQPPHRDIEKTALGATQSVPWKYISSITDFLKTLKQQGFKIIAVEQTKHSISLEKFVWNNEKTALIIGNELKGVSDDILTLCDSVIQIPQHGMKHSLNASIAAAIVMWQFFKKTIKGD